MSANAGVVVLFNKEVVEGTFKRDFRFAVDDNIGEGIHIHYKNFRLDFSVLDFLKFSNSCKKCLEDLGYSISTDPSTGNVSVHPR